ncbi:MAG: sulfurtransferase TusA family protein [Anaerosomatales bacterium]|nr:sulfurtransferase TusA family protein [Anaerosomatales bacterium]MDT8434605.1 sulfurtransferase TusA family protein [Anaerosomatales bacterium]
MSDAPNVDLELDLKGLLCPMPMVKVSQSIKDVPVGGIIRAVATDAGAMADIPAWAKSTGHEVVSALKEGSEFVFLVKRVK